MQLQELITDDHPQTTPEERTSLGANCDTLILWGQVLGARHADTADPTVQGASPWNFEVATARENVGQDEQLQAVVGPLPSVSSRPTIPWPSCGLICYFLGRRVRGKTRMSKLRAEVLFGDPRGVSRLTCAQFHTLARNREADRFTAGYLGRPRNAIL